MGLNLAEIQQKLDRLIQNIAEQNRQAYQIFYDPNPQDVTLLQLDENGNLVNVTIPNRAKILADFTAWREGAREEFVGTKLIPIDWNEKASVTYAYGNSGNIAITNGCVLKHDVNADGYTPTQSDLYDSSGNHLLTLPLHPSAYDKRAIYSAVKVHIENADRLRNFYIQLPILNKNPFTKNNNFACFGCGWFYFSRDVSVLPSFLIAPEYMNKVSVFVDGSEMNGVLDLSAGWHYIVSLFKGGVISWNTIDIIRFNFSDSDSLEPVDIVVTHLSCLANVHLSAITEKA